MKRTVAKIPPPDSRLTAGGTGNVRNKQKNQATGTSHAQPHLHHGR